MRRGFNGYLLITLHVYTFEVVTHYLLSLSERYLRFLGGTISCGSDPAPPSFRPLDSTPGRPLSPILQTVSERRGTLSDQDTLVEVCLGDSLASVSNLQDVRGEGQGRGWVGWKVRSCEKIKLTEKIKFFTLSRQSSRKASCDWNIGRWTLEVVRRHRSPVPD